MTFKSIITKIYLLQNVVIHTDEAIYILWVTNCKALWGSGCPTSLCLVCIAPNIKQSSSLTEISVCHHNGNRYKNMMMMMTAWKRIYFKSRVKSTFWFYFFSPTSLGGLGVLHFHFFSGHVCTAAQYRVVVFKLKYIEICQGAWLMIGQCMLGNCVASC